jgi:hypothetical protein
VGDQRELEWAVLKLLVPGCQTIAIPVEDLEVVAASVNEQEQVTGCWVLRKGRGHQTRKRVKAFANISRLSVEEYPNSVRESDHLELPELVLAPATAQVRQQAK